MTLVGNTLTLEDGGTVDLTPYLDNTDDQNISGSTLVGTDLTIGIENGTNETIDLSSLVGTDDQNLSGASLSGANVLQIDIENGASTTVDLSALDNSGTDDQNISGSTLVGTDLTIGIENGTNETVDLSSLVGTDDQNASEVPYTPYLTITSTDVQAAMNELKDEVDANLDGFIVGNSTFIDLQNVGSATTPDITAVLSATGTTDATTFLRGDNTWAVPPTGTDDQTASEVNSDSPIDVDGDGVTEATVEEVIQDIAPITSKAARIFYPPSIAVDASINGNFSIDLYAQYIAQYGTPTVASAGAPAAVPTYAANEIYYYVTFADPTVFNTATMSIDANGVLSYSIIGQPTDYNALINVVFVVK
jgi:hypothetical protein